MSLQITRKPRRWTIKYWWLYVHHYCPVCGSERIFRERKSLPKPAVTHEFHERYDWCDAAL